MPEPRPLPDGPLYFVGIGGAGQSALAFVLASRGRAVRGADPGIAPEVRDRLEAVGCVVYDRHAGERVGDAAAVVATDAVNESNPEVAWARARGIPVFRRPEALASVVNAAKASVCIAGTHGKTTTTGMVASILLAGKRNPTVLIGGDLPAIGGNARAGDPDLVVAESCEAYGGLDWLRPTVAVITNVEPDHLDFHSTAENFYAAFERFVANVKPGGTVVACTDDAGARRVTVGRDGLVGYSADEGEGLTLSVPGRHNVANAVGAAKAAQALGIEEGAIAAGLAGFHGAGRRFERLGERCGIAVVDDYAHHPTEIRATLAAARAAFPGRRLVAVFQPHLPSRTRDFLDAFGEALSAADEVFVTDIYLAREAPLPDVTSGHLAGRISGPPAHYVPDKADLPARLDAAVRTGDVVLVMGAGDIRPAAEGLLARLEARG